MAVQIFFCEYKQSIEGETFARTIEKVLSSDFIREDEFDERMNLYPFMIAASMENSSELPVLARCSLTVFT
jgi:hypothetical protein